MLDRYMRRNVALLYKYKLVNKRTRKGTTYMELRVLEYFLAIAREQSISGAAEYLHLSQPTLSRQIQNLEAELGKILLIRGNRKTTLTEEGMLLRKRAEEILNLVQKTEDEINQSDEIISGDIYIGSGESEGVRLLAKVGKELQKNYPDIHLHIVSGDSMDLIERFDRGLGYAIIFNNIIDITGNRNLTFRPLFPSIELNMNLVWKKYQVFNKASKLFLDKIQETLEKTD